MKRHHLAFCVALGLTAGCAPSKSEWEAKEKVKTDSLSVLTQAVISSSAMPNLKDSLHKFIRTVHVKCKVHNVIQSTGIIEDAASKWQGYVCLSNLHQEAEPVTKTAISSDSTLENTYYTSQNEMLIRVPNEKLDSFLKEMAAQVQFLDFRIIQANDVGLICWENNRKEQRIQKYVVRMEKGIDEKGKKLPEINRAEESLLAKQEQADNSLLANLSLNDQVTYSTVNLTLYQRQNVFREWVGNETRFKEFESGFFHKIKNAFVSGCLYFELVLLFLIRYWLFILCFSMFFYFYKRSKFLKQKSSQS